LLILGLAMCGVYGILSHLGERAPPPHETRRALEDG